VVSLLRGKLLSGPVGSGFVVGLFLKPHPIPLALVLVKQSSFESLSEVGFSDLFLSIALPDVNPFCHAPLTVTIIARMVAAGLGQNKKPRESGGLGGRPSRGLGWESPKFNNSNARFLV
jgi:hypothetical protein